MKNSLEHLKSVAWSRILENWKPGLTVAFISTPLSIALSIASGAGPIPGLITGVVATLIASIFASSNYNIIGPAGALATVLFAATAVPAFGIGAAVLPLLAILTGVIIFIIWALRADRFLYYVPSSIIHGFAAGVAVLIASSQLFDAMGIVVKRSGHFIHDIGLLIENIGSAQNTTLTVFVLFFAFILLWKRYIKAVPAVIPTAILGIILGYVSTRFGVVDVVTLADKFGAIKGTLFVPIELTAFYGLLTQGSTLVLLIKTALLIAVIGVLETLITAKIGDKLTGTQHSPRRELFGLSLANIASGIFGGLPATGVFLRTGANIKAGATHRTSQGISAVATAVITLVAMPLFLYLPTVVIAAMLMNTAIGLIEIKHFKEYWHHDRVHFGIALMVAGITIVEDPGLAVLAGSVLALLLIADRASRGRTQVQYDMADSSHEIRYTKNGIGELPKGKIRSVIYSIAGTASYLSAGSHEKNIRFLMQSDKVPNIIIRLRDCYTMDFDSIEVLVDMAREAKKTNTTLLFAGIQPSLMEQLSQYPALESLLREAHYTKTGEALAKIRS